MDRFTDVNNIRLHYLDHAGSGPPVILLPGLTANAHAFDGLIQAGLSPRFRVLALDLRGRGLSDKPATGYRMEDHAADVIALLDEIEIEQAIVGGHSFGGLLAMYLAARYGERVSKLIVIDASGLIVNPTSRELIKPALERLGKTVESWEVYLDLMKQAPYFKGWWNPVIESYYRADVEINEDGTVRARSRPENIAEAIDMAGRENWDEHLSRISQPAILLHALGSYGLPGAPPIVPLEHARATVEALAHCAYAEIPGNHMTMLYGDGAKLMVETIAEFLIEK